MNFFYKIIFFFTFSLFFLFDAANAQNESENFQSWLNKFKKSALINGISQNTIDVTFKDVKFLDQVIKYDRKQPEFFEDTNTYVNKRATVSRARTANKLLIKNADLFTEIEKKFLVEKEILLALWGVETNFGKHVGKMNIISCLATLSYDKRRREFFSSQLLTLLKLVDKNLVDPKKLYGSWAGAYGNFQFMPSTIKRFAIDYDGNQKIELKSSLEDSVASAANYISQIGWKINQPCFYRVKLNNKIKMKFINSSASKIKNRLKVSDWTKKGIVNYDGSDLKTNLNAALVLPDLAFENGTIDSPAFLVFENYEKILKWNKSLRFGITICTLANMIKT